MRALQLLPNKVIQSLADSMRIKAPLEYYKALGMLSSTGKKGILVHRFADKKISNTETHCLP